MQLMTPEAMGATAANDRQAAGWLSFVMSILFFRLCLDLSYVYCVSPAFTDDPITRLLVNFDAVRYFQSLGLVIVPALLVPRDTKNFSGIYFYILFVFIFLPATSIYGLNFEIDSQLIVGIYLSIVSVLFVLVLPKVDIKLPILENGERFTKILSFVFIFYFLSWSLYSGAANNINFNFSDIYSFREENGQLLDVGLAAYLNLWAEKIFSPFLIAVFLFRKKWPLVGLMYLVHVYFFAVTQHRAHLFTPVLVVAVYFLYRFNFSIAKMYVLAGTALVLFLGIVLLLHFDLAGSIIFRRALFVPASATYDWLHYFSVESKVYWTDRNLFGREPTQYTGVVLPQLLGEFKAGGKPFAFNVGLIGTGFAQAGYWGLMLYSAILGVMLRGVNLLIRGGLPPYMAAALLIAPFRTAIADSDLFSALLTHGILVGIVLLWLYGRPMAVRPLAE